MTCVSPPKGFLRPIRKKRLREAAAKIHGIVGRWIYGEGDDDLAALMLSECASRRATLAVAESCTGGMLGARLTAIPGASAVVQGGVIAYANEVKVRELGVSHDDLAAHGAVSEPVARAMASGVRVKFGTTIGIGITGIAGPDGGTPEKRWVPSGSPLMLTVTSTPCVPSFPATATRFDSAPRNWRLTGCGACFFSTRRRKDGPYVGRALPTPRRPRAHHTPRAVGSR